VGRTGLASDPARLRVEPKRIWLKIRPRAAGWTFALIPLNRPMPAWAMLACTVSTPHSTSIPTRSSRSTVPQLEVMARAPWRAMVTPQAAAITAAALLTLKVLRASIPVPEFSKSPSGEFGSRRTVSSSVMASQAPAISAAVSPLATRAARKAPCCRSGCRFSSRSRNISEVSWRERSCRSMSRWISDPKVFISIVFSFRALAGPPQTLRKGV
jgi:hypothetical protein